MTIKEKIFTELKAIDQPRLLHQIYQFVQLIKRNSPTQVGNRAQVLSFAGTLSDEEAEAMRRDIDETFHHLEGKW
jgi:hypothetical protein